MELLGDPTSGMPFVHIDVKVSRGVSVDDLELDWARDLAKQLQDAASALSHSTDG